jgi:DNA-binding phage protein
MARVRFAPPQPNDAGFPLSRDDDRWIPQGLATCVSHCLVCVHIVTYMLPLSIDEEKAMALTRDFKQTVLARAKRDPKFRQALFTEAINAYLTGDIATGKAMLRDLINATVGFEQLALEVKKNSKSLHRMLAPGGNPNTENFFGIVSALQRQTKVRLLVSAR